MGLFDKVLIVELVDGSHKISCKYEVDRIISLDNSLKIVENVISLLNEYNSLLSLDCKELIFTKTFMKGIYYGHNGKTYRPALSVEFYKYLSDKYKDEEFDYDLGGVIQIGRGDMELQLSARPDTRITINLKKAIVCIDNSEENIESYKKEHENDDLSTIAEIPFNIEKIAINELGDVQEFFRKNHCDLYKMGDKYYRL